MFVLMFTLMLTATVAQTTDSAPPELQLPEAPEPQPGDDTVVDTTVGHMRNALFYYELVPILIDHNNELYEYGYEVAKRADTERAGRLIAEQQCDQWRRRFIYAGSAGLIITLAATILLIIT